VLTVRTTHEPDADLLLRWHVVQNLGDDVSLQYREGIGVTEELGDADQEILVERIELVGVDAEVLDVAFERVGVDEIETALHAPPDGRHLVEREVDPEAV